MTPYLDYKVDQRQQPHTFSIMCLNQLQVIHITNALIKEKDALDDRISRITSFGHNADPESLKMAVSKKKDVEDLLNVFKQGHIEEINALFSNPEMKSAV